MASKAALKRRFSVHFLPAQTDLQSDRLTRYGEARIPASDVMASRAGDDQMFSEVEHVA